MFYVLTLGLVLHGVYVNAVDGHDIRLKNLQSLCWGDSESSLSYTKNKRMSLVAQVPVRKA
jgi:hypothetical protein